MSTNDNSSITDTINLFYSESNKLEDTLSQSLKNSEKLSLSEIIGLYYQIINVTSLVKFLRQNIKDAENMKEETLLLQRIQKIEKHIDEKFDSDLHLLLISNLEKSIETLKIKLKDSTMDQPKKTKEEVENQAKMYEELRQIMSTKEFVDQYSNGLDNKL
ncbi:MAG: hypothetical protein OES14_08205 [Nitrosopumilus sp.]|nr:hypothetical protein [Nitrosopumilus sp.]MDH3825759.1 hypothetical protein [Nitrosopumilus sp.]